MPEKSAAPDFRRHWWLPSAHLETIHAAYNKTPAVDYQRHIAQTRDNDEIAVDLIPGGRQQPMLIIFHGLEGCSHSRTVRLLAHGFSRLRWTVILPHFRSCGGHMNRLPRGYHALDTRDMDWMVEYCRHYRPHQGLFAAGISLGGNTLTHWLADNADAPIDAGLTVSTPFDLSACVKNIDSGFNRLLYSRHFLKTMRAKILTKAKSYPFICDLKKLRKAGTIAEFDSLYTAPVHGFASAEAYWQQANAAAALARISKPLLCVNALNDPLVPAATLPDSPPMQTPSGHGNSNGNIHFQRPKHGGHGGFSGEPEDWLFNTARQFFSQHAPSPRADSQAVSDADSDEQDRTNP